jgi:tRNA pseudouridine38-40 synthase
MQRYKLVIEYCGTLYNGWQNQKKNNHKTIQEIIENAIKQFIGYEVKVIGCGRTDKGVHSLGMTAHVDLCRKNKKGEIESPYPKESVLKAINFFIGKKEKIKVIDVEMVPNSFHARYSVIKKTYFYYILSNCSILLNFKQKPLFYSDLSWMISKKLNIEDMKLACNILVGTHDFSSFRASNCQAKSPIRTLEILKIEEINAPFLLQNWKNIQSFQIVAVSKSFLYHQVRNMVAALVAVGEGKLTIKQLEHLLKEKNRNLCPPTAPACGLYLASVEY